MPVRNYGRGQTQPMAQTGVGAAVALSGSQLGQPDHKDAIDLVRAADGPGSGMQSGRVGGRAWTSLP